MRALVPFIEHGWSAVFPAFAPGAVHVMAAVAHSAEEDHLHEAEEEKQEEDGAADGAEWEETEVMAIAKAIWVAIAVTVHHRRDGCGLSIFSGLGDGSSYCGSLGNALGLAGSEYHKSASGDEANQEQDSNDTKN